MYRSFEIKKEVNVVIDKRVEMPSVMHSNLALRSSQHLLSFFTNYPTLPVFINKCNTKKNTRFYSKVSNGANAQQYSSAGYKRGAW